MSTRDTEPLILPAGGPPFLQDEQMRDVDRARHMVEIDNSAEDLRKSVLASGGRNPVFALLVEGEDDVAGLVAYSLYKQSKRDWMMEFSGRNGRTPNDDEIDSYILGERTPRRIATYRKLATDLLARNRKSGQTVESLLAGAPQGAPEARSGSRKRGWSDQVQLFAVAAAIGALAALIAVHAVPHIVAQ
jgi:hypothetical protein